MRLEAIARVRLLKGLSTPKQWWVLGKMTDIIKTKSFTQEAIQGSIAMSVFENSISGSPENGIPRYV